MKINLTHLTQYPVYVRLVCFILALLLLWLPLAVPIYWLVVDSNLESILTIVILYVEFILLLNIWGKKVYQQPGIFRRYGLEFTRFN
ncbi:MAG: CPBP family intramembrane glutamate endopeptidase, partial [Dolichospermum sp.]